MGYTTEFTGSFQLNKPLDKKTAKLINGLNRTRRMKRDLTKLGMTQEEANQYGIDGEFYCPPKSNFCGQDNDASIVDFNEPPETQPGLWCGWRYSKTNNCIKWDGGEKFYHYVSWLKYLIDNILGSEYQLNGEVTFQGEDEDDKGTIIVENNVIVVKVNDRKCTKKYLTSDHQYRNLLTKYQF